MLRRNKLPAQVSGLADSTEMDPRGAVTSIQSADVSLPAGDLESIWSEHWLERLARTYWLYLSKVTLGLIRVVYSEDGRQVVLLFSPFKLLTFAKPEYELTPTHGSVTWRIAGGLLVARKNEGLLRIVVSRPTLTPDPFSTEVDEAPSTVRVDVEVSNFYPAIAARISSHLYRWTQSAIHVFVTYGFLRSLARGELAESKAKQFAEPD